MLDGFYGESQGRGYLGQVPVDDAFYNRCFTGIIKTTELLEIEV